MPKIFLDYGHGGTDPGAVVGDYKEKDFNLKIGLRVAYHLKRHQQTVVESRINDTTMSLSERSSKANNNNVDICVSLHCNSFSQNSAQGLETYYYNGSVKGKNLAGKIQNSIINAKLYSKNRGLKTDNLHMTREVKAPAVLVEMGFISNDTDRGYLSKTEDMAIAIAKGILDYWEIPFDNESSKNSSDKLYKVQVGAFKEKTNADRLNQELRTKGYNSFIVEV